MFICGIVAYWNKDGSPVHKETLSKAVERLRHRGPDDEGYIFIDSFSQEWVAYTGQKSEPRVNLPNIATHEKHDCDLALGHARLSILDLSPAGHQPMSSRDGRFHIVLNGEIYNFQDIRDELKAYGYTFVTNTDTEVALASYQEWGTDCLKRFNGMWAMVIWDSVKRRMFISRDRLGIKPLVYYRGLDLFACASELDALLSDSRIPHELDPEALHHYLSLMTVPAPFTIYKGIHKLLPGHYMIVEESKISTVGYWHPEPGERKYKSEDEACEQLEGLLKDSIRLRLIADVPVGAFLSGGVDSSIVSALASKNHSDGSFRTFHISFPGMTKYDESTWAQNVAAHIESNHSEFNLKLEFTKILQEISKILGEPFGVSSVLGVYLLAREARKYVKVVLTGDGGDEAFAGYIARYDYVDSSVDNFQRKPFGWLRANTAINGWPNIRWRKENVLQRLTRRWHFEHIPDQVLKDRRFFRIISNATDYEKYSMYTSEWSAKVGETNTEEWMINQIPPMSNNRLSRWQKFDIATTLSDEMLSKADKATMAWGLEARVPLLDHRIIEFALGLPPDLRIRGQQGKYIIKTVGEKYLPPEVLLRRKHGFSVPLQTLLDREYLLSAINLDEIEQQGIFKKDVIRFLIEQFTNQGKYSNLLFSILCFQLWKRNVEGKL